MKDKETGALEGPPEETEEAGGGSEKPEKGPDGIDDPRGGGAGEQHRNPKPQTLNPKP